MSEITLDEEQVEYLEELRDHIAEEHVGPYGHVRMREAVQFLIDRYESESATERETVREVVEAQLSDHSYQELQTLAAETEGVEPGGKEAQLRQRLVEARVEDLLTKRGEAERGENEEVAEGANEEMAENERGSESSEAGETEGSEESASATDSDPTADAPDSDEADEDAGTDADAAAEALAEVGGSSSGAESSSGTESGSGGKSRLQRMMGLLDDHDDAWEETDSDEGKYAVTLPDGSVENVRTKDDVRALLFRHYD